MGLHGVRAWGEREGEVRAASHGVIGGGEHEQGPGGGGVEDGGLDARAVVGAEHLQGAVDHKEAGACREGPGDGEARDGAVMTAGDSGGALVRADGAGGYVVVAVASLYAEARWSLCVRVAPHAAWIRGATSRA